MKRNLTPGKAVRSTSACNMTPIAAAVAMLIAGASFSVHAQEAAQQAPDATTTSAKPAKPGEDPAVVTVTGVRAALAQSLAQKRNADSHIEVITAEDIGKMPDKNVADSLERVPGVNVSNAGASEGGFDENDRVSMRGTNPNLTQTLINGHNVASGDWFILNQTTQVGRSVSYTLVPSEVVGSVVVHKSSEASLVEGGVAGSVDIVTRRPLDFKDPFSAEASLGAVYADLPKKTDPQFSALLNWQNEGKTFGALLQVFSETRHLRRDGQEVLSYSQISPTSPMALAHPDLANAYYPGFIGASLFQQERKRTGGLLDLELKPSRDLDLDLNGFSSKLKADNTNDNYLLSSGSVINGGQGQMPTSYTVKTTNGVKTLTSAVFAPVAGTNYNEYDQISRPGEEATANFLSLDGKLRVNDDLTLRSKMGVSRGVGSTPTQDVVAWNGATGTGASYKLNGAGTAADFGFGGLNSGASPGTTSNPGESTANTGLGWIFGDQNVSVVDSEKWLQLDADYAVSAGPLNLLKFGVRAANHDRSSEGVIGQGPSCSTQTDNNGGPGLSSASNLLPSQYSCLNGATSPFNPANWPAAGTAYPSNFGSGLGGVFPRTPFEYTAAQLAAFGALYSNRNADGSREDFGNEFSLAEKTRAAYLQGNMDGEGWSGNIGLRWVQTKEHSISNVGLPGNYPLGVPGVVYTSAFGIFQPTTVDHTYNDWLPSANLRLDLSKDLVARFALSKTMTRPDFSSLVGTFSLTPPAGPGQVGSGSGGNPDLKPITSNNLDVSLEWYFAPRSLLSGSLYYMDLTNYIGEGTTVGTYRTFTTAQPNGFDAQYLITSPINSKAKVKGMELSFQRPLFGNFGIATTGTFTDAKDDSGAKVLGSSKRTYNASAYYENDKFNARITWGYRSESYVGLDRGTEFNQMGGADVNASLGYQITKKISLALDMRNLNNPKLKYYALNEDQPRSVYENGRQFFLTMRMKY
ncbi:MAG TPA: TonB-dependent receptor [Janthinobacterium sp.]|jgi:iron complex outermembrane receptor protein|nr:TonB-dependent receptor [Janthinobacterium sp.]